MIAAFARPLSPAVEALRLCLFLILFAVSAGPATAQGFRTDRYDSYAQNYQTSLVAVAKGLTKSLSQLQKDLASTEAAGNARNTAVVLEQVLTRSPRDGELWQKLASLLLVAEPLNNQDGYELPGKALGAAIIAYRLSRTPTDQAESLALLAQALAKKDEWRPAINAYKASLVLADNDEVRQAYEALRAEHGFRITNYTVESDAAQPRICFEFSDPLDATVSDFAPYFTLDPGPVSAVTAEGSKLCLEGLKHGTRYAVTARQGLPSGLEEPLSQNFDYAIYVRDRAPSVRFAGKSYVLPRTGQNGVPIVSVNSRQAKLALYRIGDRSLTAAVIDSNFLQQLYGEQAATIGRSQGQKVWQGTIDTASVLNQDVTTAFPVDEALGRIESGLYVMTAEPAEKKADDYGEVATQWFVVSDLGLSTVKGKDGLHVSVRSIASAEPLPDVEVRLLARNNEVLGALRTGADGVAAFDAGLTKGTEGLQPAIVVASDRQGDYGFLDLTEAAFDLTDRGVSGREPPGAIDAFVYTERGVYRRGETVHAAILLRDEKANAVANAPVVVVVERPDGVEESRTTLADQGGGGRTLDIGIIASAASGTWRVKAYTDPKAAPAGETSFLVEDYVPDRIEFDLKAEDTRMTRDQGARLTVDGRYLFGAPAANLDLEGNISVSVDEEPFAEWKGYAFGLTDETVETVQNEITDLPQTDAKGHAGLAVALPDLPTTSRPLEARIDVRLREPGGRAVEESVTMPIAASENLLGLKPAFGEGGVREGEPAAFELIALNPDGSRIEAKSAQWTLKRLTTTYQWFSTDGSWNYEPVTKARKVAGGSVDIGKDASARLSVPVEWGEYRLEIAANGMQPASKTFSVGYFATTEADTPDTLPVALDRTSVRSGDTINVKIDARFPGKASVEVVGDRLFSSTLVDVPEGGMSVPVTVGTDWGTGAYVVVRHFRPIDVAAKRMPTRSIGLAWFGIDRDERTLQVALSPAATMKPRQALRVPIKVAGLAAGDEAYVTVAAVDVGILNLTNYKPPAPDAHYFDQKSLSAELRDLYGQLIDGMQGTRGRIRSGGDGGADEIQGSPPAQAPLALFSGIVRVGADGTAEVAFDIPAFNGTVRVMAVAWTPTKVGHAAADVVVRDPVVIAGTLPRFLAAGDQSRFRLDLLNAEAPAGDYTLAVTVDGPITAEPSALYQTVKIGTAGSRTPVDIPIKAEGVGVASFVATLAGPGGVSIDQRYALGVEPANPAVTRRTVREIAAHGGSITVSSDLLAEMLPGTGRVSLSVGPLTELDVPGLLKELDRYPYGCSEQLVSRALPLLYLSELGTNAAELDTDVKERLADTVQRLLARQDASGAFGLWNSYGEDLWLSAYVTDFLLRAREKGFAVPEQALTSAVDYLRNRVGNAPEVEDGKGEDVAYALYTLARAGRAPAGDLKYFADTKIGQFGTPLARAQIAAALGLLGDKPRADEAFASAATALSEAAGSASRTSRSDYGSVLRDAAAIVALAADTKTGLPVIKTASEVITAERAKSRYASTQEMTWMVLAARAVVAEARSITLTADGETRQGSFYKLFRQEGLARPFTVANPGDTALKAVVAVSGSPQVAEPAAQNGFALTRQYFTQAGEPVDPTTLAQNTRLVVVLSATPLGDKTGNFLLVDPLPAGFEIENPTLVGSGDAGQLSWLGELTQVTHSEFRDDRFVAAFENGAAKVAYTVRAVAPGRYVHPGTSVEDMYRPDINARLASTSLTVTAK
jgi:uncharacterized protein YfaS (alpha-2-macroglobulin family)